ncbi:MAG: mechanosensitive ion channel family protein [Spirochaetota bacterium]
MENLFEKTVIDPTQQLSSMVSTYLPHIFAAIIIILCGFILAWLLGYAASRTARLFNVDKYSKSSEFSRLLKKAKINKRLSDIIGRTIYWIILFVFSILSLSALKIPAMDALLGKFLFFIPSFFIAAVLLIIGYIIALFIERTILIMMVNRGFNTAGVVSKAVKYLILVIAVTMSFEQLGIAHTTLMIFFAIVFGGAVLALSLAFGLGGKDLAKEYLSNYISRDKKKDSFRHL